MERIPLYQNYLYDFITRLNNGLIDCPVYIEIIETGEKYNISKSIIIDETGQKRTHYAWERQ